VAGGYAVRSPAGIMESRRYGPNMLVFNDLRNQTNLLTPALRGPIMVVRVSSHSAFMSADAAAEKDAFRWQLTGSSNLASRL
jgi:hypothetical protein